MEKKKLNSELVRKLRSDKQNLVIPSISVLRNSVHSAVYIPEVIHLLSETKNDEIRRELSFFLCDIKDSSGIPYIIEALQDKRYKKIWNLILSACWQSGLNYSKNLEPIINIFLKEDYLTSLEAFSVIEQSISQLEEEKIKKYRNELMAGFDDVAEEKKPLVREMINLMQV